MKKLTIYPAIVILFLCCVLAGCSSTGSTLQPTTATLASQAQPEEFLIQPGDQLDIKFFYNQELNETVTVRSDGKISLQLVDEIMAGELRPMELDLVLTEKYSAELRKPAITVIVRASEGRRVYIGGEVNQQGLIPLVGNMTPLQAVLNAGGFKETANPEMALLIRKGHDNSPVPYTVNLRDELEGDSTNPVFLLQSNDIIYVPKTAIAKANKFVNQYIENLLLFKGVSLGFTYEINDVND